MKKDKLVRRQEFVLVTQGVCPIVPKNQTVGGFEKVIVKVICRGPAWMVEIHHRHLRNRNKKFSGSGIKKVYFISHEVTLTQFNLQHLIGFNSEPFSLIAIRVLEMHSIKQELITFKLISWCKRSYKKIDYNGQSKRNSIP